MATQGAANFSREGTKTRRENAGREDFTFFLCENLAPVHGKQLTTYLRLLNLTHGLLMNFGSAIFKNGIKRIVNNHSDFAASRFRVHQGLLEDVHT